MMGGDKAIAGSLFIVAAPSGAGKTSLVKALLANLSGLALSLSTTTRPMRPGEVDGVDYHFVDPAAFEVAVAQGRFLEHARVFDHYYGTSGDTVQGQLDQGLDVILEIDWQGADQVRAVMPGCRSIYILPPSRSALAQRLRGRGQDDEAQIKRRMADAVSEMVHYDAFDYVIVNDDFDQAGRELQAIFVARRLEIGAQRQRQRDLIARLLS